MENEKWLGVEVNVFDVLVEDESKEETSRMGICEFLASVAKAVKYVDNDRGTGNTIKTPLSRTKHSMGGLVGI